MMLAILLATVQASSWSVAPVTATIGDTVVLSRRLVTGAAVQVRALPVVSTQAVESLTEPVVTYAEGVVTVRHRLAFFAPGPHTIALPDLEIVHPDGRLERLTGDTARVSIVPLLPADSAVSPRPVLDPLPRRVTTPVPLIGLVGSVLAALILWGMVRRRVGMRPTWAPPPAIVEPPLGEWAESGEHRAVAAAVSADLRAAMEAAEPAAGRHLSTDQVVALLRDRRSGWPVDELARVLRALDRARFAPATASDVQGLVASGRELKAVMTEHTEEPA